MLQHHTVCRRRYFSRGTIFFTMHAFYPFIFLPAKPAIITQSVEHLLIQKQLPPANTQYIIHPFLYHSSVQMHSSHESIPARHARLVGLTPSHIIFCLTFFYTRR